MSMTQVAFLRKDEIPTNKQIQDSIQKLGYDFKILDDLKKRIDQDGLECAINGHKTYFEIYLDNASEIAIEEQWIKHDLTDQDTAISFVWGADFAAGACIGLLSIALIDHSKALVYYMDDQIKYTREMLVLDIPQFLEELKKENDRTQTQTTQKLSTSQPTISQTKKNFWDRLKNMFK